MTATAVGPSGGVLGSVKDNNWTQGDLDRMGEFAKAAVTAGRFPRPGHDRARWETVSWADYRARVGIGGRAGPWRTWMAEEVPGTPAQWITEAEGLPFVPGWYTTLTHDTRGLVMSDVPGEVAGAIPFMDRVKAEAEADAAHCGAPVYRVLIGGLGLGVVPAWLLASAPIRRLDVVEIDADVIELVARDATAAEELAGDGRLHVHNADVLTWRPPPVPGCALHADCEPAKPPHWQRPWQAVWFDIWDLVAAQNLASMHRLHRRYARWAGWQMSWERATCEAKRARDRAGLTPIRCLMSEAGYGGDDG